MNYAKSLSHVQIFATPWTVAHQAPLSMGFSGQEYWSGLPFPSPPFNYIQQKKPSKEPWLSQLDHGQKDGALQTAGPGTRAL